MKKGSPFATIELVARVGHSHSRRIVRRTARPDQVHGWLLASAYCLSSTSRKIGHCGEALG